MKKLSWILVCLTFLCLEPIVMNNADAATVTYLDRSSFYAQLGTVLIDDFENYPLGSMTDTQMSAVLGETAYANVTFGDYPSFLVNSGNFNAESRAFCNGCNGSTLLGFTSTSVGTPAGVDNVGFDIVGNTDFPKGMGNYNAVVTFGDSSTEAFALPIINDSEISTDGTFYKFWGIHSSLLIESILLERGGSFGMDNLVIGGSGGGVTAPRLQCHGCSTSPVPVPATVWLFVSGLVGLIGVTNGIKHS